MNFFYRTVTSPDSTDRAILAALRWDVACAALALGVRPPPAELIEVVPVGRHDLVASCSIGGLYDTETATVRIERETAANDASRWHVARHEIVHHACRLRGSAWGPEEEAAAEVFARRGCRQSGRRCVLCERPLDWVVDTAAGASVAVSKKERRD